MLLRRIVHIVLIFTLAIQLFPSNQAGRFFISGCPEDENTDFGASKSLRQLIEEEKEIHTMNDWITLHFVRLNTAVFHFSEKLPLPHAGAVHTPPPNGLA